MGWHLACLENTEAFAEWHTPLIPALGRQKPVYFYGFLAVLIYTQFQDCQSHIVRPVLKNDKNNKKIPRNEGSGRGQDQRKRKLDSIISHFPGHQRALALSLQKANS